MYLILSKKEMPYKIDLPNFVNFLLKKKISIKDVEDILKFIGVEEEKIAKLLPKETQPEENEEKELLAYLEREVISLSFDVNNLKTLLESHKSKEENLEKRVSELENKTNNILRLLEENLPLLAKRMNDKRL
jgi:predicted RNase H-like nuclease (RuvC/YqgF family)